ncbi:MULTISPECIES: amino acid ABC transporter permease [unclassified Dietzia]|uniref:amino acid ABC transporter permease n=1 Tax=unclassified Dietzia TaxID=2617939 RepID=UPI0015F8B1D3|nr:MULTISPECIES: amino acid ABC transporter permease [unclassified Dietzia]MBB1024388.1 amino acid ABC transporter permease [Dietzia sp. DQ12-76]MBB1027639.1 amino acid ABC transporter permease [Dietzia sp. DQ11-38-2]
MSTAHNGASAPRADAPDPIEAVPLRHPWRWVSATIVLALVFLFVWGAATNPAYGWGTYGRYLFDTRFGMAVFYTIALTVLSMILAVILGVILSVMRMSSNPVLKAVAWVYLWIFRGTPIYVQLLFWGLIFTLYRQVQFGIPFTDFQIVRFDDTMVLYSAFWLAVVGLAMNEAAYMAEIVRAGISSVPEGQAEASTALGMSWGQTMRRTILPQAMRVIIPPTGNELISMLKTTSLVVAIPFSGELYGQARDISGVNFQPIPLLLVAATWYLVITSVLMVGQHFLEKKFSRGSTRQLTAKQLRALAEADGLTPSGLAAARGTDQSGGMP